MEEKYKTPGLCNYYCSHECPIGQKYVPEVQIKDLSQITLEMLASLNAMEKEKNLTVTLEQIKNFNEEEWQKFRQTRWEQKHETYNNKDNIPEWFWPSQKDADNDFRKKAWIKKCNKYAVASKPADWFMPTKESYIQFLEKVAIRKAKIEERKSSKK